MLNYLPSQYNYNDYIQILLSAKRVEGFDLLSLLSSNLFLSDDKLPMD